MNGADEDERGFFSEMAPDGRIAAESMPQPGPGEPRPHFHGHRERLRDRFRETGASGLADYEILELLLCRSITRRDTKPLAKALIARFGSLAEVLGASEKLLREVDGIGPQVAFDLTLVAASAGRMIRSEIASRPLLGSWSQVIDYCRAAMAFQTQEQFRILFLDRKNVLIRDEVQQTGTVDHTPVYPREVVRRALELSASAMILVHNHPSGDPTPSHADIEMTRTIIQSAAPLGIAVHDHVVIGRNGHASLKGLQLI